MSGGKHADRSNEPRPVEVAALVIGGVAAVAPVAAVVLDRILASEHPQGPELDSDGSRVQA